MRILFLTQWFQPEPNFFMGLPFARELVRRGHEVEVLTGFPNYPGGKLFNGYQIKLCQRERLDGIPVIRLPLYPSHDRSSVRRILNYMSLAVSSGIMGPFLTRPADVCFVYQGPVTLGVPAVILRTLKKIPFVWNIQDLWPDSLLSTGMFNSRIGLKIVDWWCKFVYKSAAKITVITPGFKRKLCERSIPEDKIEVIYNWCDDVQISSSTHSRQRIQEPCLASKFNIVFAGNIGKAQAMDAVIQAAAIIKHQYSDVQFVMVGGGVEVDSLKQKTADMKLSNVIFLPRRPVSEIGALLSLADVLLVHLRNDPLFEITIPSKTQAYMAVGRPILMGVKGDAAELVTKADAGLTCTPEDPASIVEAVKKFRTMSRAELDQMGTNGKRFYEQQLSFKAGTDKYERIFESVANRKK